MCGDPAAPIGAFPCDPRRHALSISELACPFIGFSQALITIVKHVDYFAMLPTHEFFLSMSGVRWIEWILEALGAEVGDELTSGAGGRADDPHC